MSSHSLFTNYSTIWRCIFWDTSSVMKQTTETHWTWLTYAKCGSPVPDIPLILYGMKIFRSPGVTEMMYDAIKARRQEFLRTQNMNTTFLTNEIINAVYGTSFGFNYRIHPTVFLFYNYLILTEYCSFSYWSCCILSTLYSFCINCNAIVI
jgi:hypothetical protein